MSRERVIGEDGREVAREGCGEQIEAMARLELLLEVRWGPLEELRSDII